MATYPTLSTAYGGDPDPISSISIDRSEDGQGRGRSFYTTDKSKFSIVHERLSSAEVSTLQTFYLTNKFLAFNYTSPADNVLRSCIFAKPISYKREYGNFWTATVTMEEV